MVTYNQLVQNKCRKKKRKLNRTPALRGNPQAKGICSKVFIRSPKKPNSAKRKVIKIRLWSKSRIESYVPGIGHNLQQYSVVLIRGGRVPDLPGCKYHTIRGKYDFKGVVGRKTSRSLYGVKRK